MGHIGIIGGGPAGLSLAKMLSENAPYTRVTVLEAADRIGGKSHTLCHAGLTVEMGTCYTTGAYRQLHRWCRAHDIPLRSLEGASYDGKPFTDFINQGSGKPLAWQVAVFLFLKHRLFSRMHRDTDPEQVHQELSQPALPWLESHGLHKLIRMMYRSQTAMGYGHLDTVSLYQVMIWHTLGLFVFGRTNTLNMPVHGWSHLWETLSADLNVQCNAKVTHIDRNLSDGVRVITENGTTHMFSQVVNTLPMDTFVKIATPTRREKLVQEAIEWQTYTTTLFTSHDWFTDVPVIGYTEGLLPGAAPGTLVGARYEGQGTDGLHYYLAGQASGPNTPETLQTQLVDDVARLGHATVNDVIARHEWQYFPQYNSAALADGLLLHMKQMQGQSHTWHSGASFSFESVNNIMTFNRALMKRMLSEC